MRRWTDGQADTHTDDHGQYTFGWAMPNAKYNKLTYLLTAEAAAAAEAAGGGVDIVHTG